MPMTPEALGMLLSEGGFGWTHTACFEQTRQGRIHQSWIVETGVNDESLLLQQLNRGVIADTGQFTRVNQLMLSRQGIPDSNINWPATGSPLFRHGNGTWFCRRLVKAVTPAQPCNESQIQAMTRALHRYHHCVSSDEFRRIEYCSVNPWNPQALQTLRAQCAERRLASESNAPDSQLLQIYRESADVVSASIGTPESATETVVHRDPKPSNFLQLQTGDMILIDYDTTGLGNPVQDLGEMVRALASRDECEHLAPMTRDECTALLVSVSHAYPGEHFTAEEIRNAACRSCLWQAARFLEDHLTGDIYYPVSWRGENAERAGQQLRVLSRLAGNSALVDAENAVM